MSESLQPLDLEMQTYRNHKDALLTSSEGKFVLIHGASILGTFAIKNGGRRRRASARRAGTVFGQESGAGREAGPDPDAEDMM